MKIMSFYAEKGGMGKTTFSIMFASWLKYCKKENVYVMDFDFPSHQFDSIRKSELELMGNPANISLTKLAVPESEYYKVITCGGPDMTSPESLSVITESLRRQKAKYDGYLICDFPGHFQPGDPVRAIAAAGILDLLVYMVDSDRQSSRSMFATLSDIRRIVRKPGGQKVTALWNRETTAERADKRAGKRDNYLELSNVMTSMGVDVIEQHVHDMPIFRREGDYVNFVRSTVCFPETNIKKACPYLPDVFEEIKDKIDRAYLPVMDL